jgi:hypothetical protein
MIRSWVAAGLLIAGLGTAPSAAAAPRWVSGLEATIATSESDQGAFALGPAARKLRFPFVPDPALTQGSICDENDPDFERHRYAEQIPYCGRNVSGWTKRQVYINYGVDLACKGEYTIDHFIPLSIGGTNRIDNLWPEPKSVKSLRQNLEMHLFRAVESGRMSQKEAIMNIQDAKWNPPVRDPASWSFCR